jgi:hypothetical protein
LPHVDPEVAKLYAYPQRFAEQVFERVEHALRRRAAEGASEREASAAARTGRVFILAGDDLEADSKAAAIPDLPARYIRSSDTQLVAAQKADAHDPVLLASERLEGHFVLSYATSGGWVAFTKDFLTEVLGAGRDVKIGGLPSVAVERLRLMCRDLVAVANRAQLGVQPDDFRPGAAPR